MWASSAPSIASLSFSSPTYFTAKGTGEGPPVLTCRDFRRPLHRCGDAVCLVPKQLNVTEMQDVFENLVQRWTPSREIEIICVLVLFLNLSLCLLPC